MDAMSSQEQHISSEKEQHRRLNHDDYTIAIICPMKTVQAPVIALLDETHQSLPMRRDYNAYELGKMGQHNVVVVTMPKIGNNAAAITVTQLLNDFRLVRFSLLVGVGGGIPDEDYEDEDLNDVRLGDVVVSESRGQFGGVVQFDRGKSTNDKFVRTGHLNSPPQVLAGNVEKLKAKHMLQGDCVLQYLAEIFGRYPEMEEQYSNPGSEQDKLFRADYSHKDGKTCEKCDTSKIIKRTPRRFERPRIHYGTIGSSNMVVESSQKRDELRDEMNLLCVEMEAAGLMEAFPSLVVCGISNYTDSHKNKIWKSYAAATAAAYTKELLLQIPSNVSEGTQGMSESMQGLSAKIDKNIAVLCQIHKQLRSM
jgi:nucleoside phosphorylase